MHLSTEDDPQLWFDELESDRVDWINLDDGLLVIPKNESTKNEDPWECSLRDKTTRLLRKWLDERKSYEKYQQRDGLWLTEDQPAEYRDCIHHATSDD